MSRKFRIVKTVFLWLSIVLFLAIPIGSLISTALFWQGTCSWFFTFGEKCTWQTYTMLGIITISIFVVPVLFVTFSVWLSMTAAQFITARRK